MPTINIIRVMRIFFFCESSIGYYEKATFRRQPPPPILWESNNLIAEMKGSMKGQEDVVENSIRKTTK